MIKEKTAIILFSCYAVVWCRSLSDVICRLNPANCGELDQTQRVVKAADEPIRHIPSGRQIHPPKSFGGPSDAEFQRWQHYEEWEPGTGLHPDAGQGYGPGLGDVEVRSALGVQYGVGDVNIRRDFGLFMGGSGRSGGQAFGWGNGAPFRNGAAPWANPLG